MAIDLADIVAGNGGFVICGAGTNRAAGFSVSSAGDVNGDGFDDVIVGTTTGGSAYVVYGSAAGAGAPVDLAAVEAGDGTLGTVLSGPGGLASGPLHVSSVGDVNGDGFADVLVGVSPNGFPGKVFVVFGKAGGLGSSVNFATPTPDSGFIGYQDGFGYSTNYGTAASSLGDVNGDGFDDFIVGADAAANEVTVIVDREYYGSYDEYYVDVEYYFSDYAGKAHLSFGGSDGRSGLTTFRGLDAGDGLGSSVSSAGDVNGDGYADVIIGAATRDANGEASGTSYVVFGNADGAFPASLDGLTGGNGFAILGEQAFDWSGKEVSGGGDINGDGFDDVIVGARYADGPGDSRDRAGDSYVVFGKAGGFDAALELADIAGGDGSQGFVIHGEQAGDIAFRVASVGDLNGDGFDDLAIGARKPSFVYDYPGTGAVYVVFGKAGGFGNSLDLATVAAGIGGFVIQAEELGDGASRPSGGGDIDGDGFDDLLIGASGADGPGNTRNAAGAVYVIFGSATLGGSSSQVTDQGGDGNDVLTGDGGADVMIGGGGNDFLSGNGGLDVLRGGAGDDVLSVGGGGIRQVSGGSGEDTLRLDGATLVDPDFSQVDGIERIRLGQAALHLQIGARATQAIETRAATDPRILIDSVASAATHVVDGSALRRGMFADLSDNAGGVTVTGGYGADTIYGGVGIDTITGGSGADMLAGFAGDDRLEGNDGDDSLHGGNGNDALHGGQGADTLNGSAGDDTAAGGLGDDLYIVDSSGDKITEASGAGLDTVRSTAEAFILSANIENLILLGSAPTDGIGNASANAITGNFGANLISGAGGADLLLGNGGDDQLQGGAGNDTLDGGSGADVMNGGTGDDVFKVDHAGDRIVEAVGGGNDQVETKVSYTLGAGREIETLAAIDPLHPRAIDLTGNEFANLLIGNAGINRLDGDGANDELHGLGGNDVLVGGFNDDRLVGGAGADRLEGGAGADLFVYETIADSGIAAGTRDTIAGFVHGEDRIDLSAIDARAGLPGNSTFSFISTRAFSDEGQVRAFKSGGSTIVELNTAGASGAESRIVLEGSFDLTAANFIL